MSVSVGGAGGGYDDFEVQHGKWFVFVEQTDTIDTEAAQVQVFEPVGGLARGEIAELVALEAQPFIALEGSTATETADLRMVYELTSDADFRLSFNDVPEVDSDLEGTGVQLFEDDEMDIDRLLHGVANATGMVEDDTNGVGAGGTETWPNHSIPYRERYGGGPTYDRHNELFWHAEFTETGAIPARAGVAWTAVWDILQAG